MPNPISVVVDAMWREGTGQVALRLLGDTTDPLPSVEPGAHLDLHLPGGLRRPYSIASAPAERDSYLLCVKRETLSRGGPLAVHDRVRVGERLFVSAPRGGFGLRPAAHHVLLAGGIGITPILPMADGRWPRRWRRAETASSCTTKFAPAAMSPSARASPHRTSGSASAST